MLLVARTMLVPMVGSLGSLILLVLASMGS